MIRPLLLIALLGAPLCAEGPTFDVATVKKADEPQLGKPIFFGRRGGPGTDDPGRITWSQVNLRTLLTTAYDVRPYQITGPDWLDSERFEIVAKVPAGATKEQVNVMWQNLLADRFGVALHHSSKVMQAYELSAVKGGAKLKPTTLDPKAIGSESSGGPPGALAFGPPPPPGPAAGGAITASRGPGPEGPSPFPGGPKLDKDGIPQFDRPGIFQMMTMGPNGPSARLIGKAQTVEQLSLSLSNQLDRPVVDKTGLTGSYDFIVEFTPDLANGRGPMRGLPPPPALPPGDSSQSPNAAEPGGMTLIGAVQAQLGLKLTSIKTAVDMIIIDKAEKAPTEN